MRILHINKFAFPKGGAENYMLRTAAKQASSGSPVAILGAQAELSGLGRSISSYGLDVPDYHALAGPAKIRAAKDVLWSKPAALIVGKALDDFKPDVVHLHNYAHQLSSSILAEIRKRKVPSIYTAHDYKLICPAYVANVDNKDCFACSDNLSVKLMEKRCHHGSVPWSAVVGVEALLVRRGKWVPDVIVGPSQFMTDALSSSWLGRLADVRLLRNPVEGTGIRWRGAGNYLLYVGRLSREKGVDQLLVAATKLGLPLKIAGEGPIRKELEQIAASGGAAVEFMGHLDQDALALLRRDCTAQVLSSTWPENAPLSALEAAADGVPLIVTARGGLPEFAEIGARVAVVENLGHEELRRAVACLPELRSDLERFASETAWENHLAALMKIYEDSRGR